MAEITVFTYSFFCASDIPVLSCHQCFLQILRIFIDSHIQMQKASIRECRN